MSNTTVYTNDAGNTAVMLHNTTILTFASVGIVINSGGYKTDTTKRRLNQYIKSNGWQIVQRGHRWLVVHNSGEEFTFADNMLLHYSLPLVRYNNEWHVNAEGLHVLDTEWPSAAVRKYLFRGH